MIELKKFIMPDGTLTPIEFSACPFVPRRLFWIEDVPSGQDRANHAHRQCHQFLFMIRGMLTANVDRKEGREIIQLQGTATLYIPNLSWLVLTDISPNAIIGVLASLPYDVEDYIDDYEEFLKCRES